MPKLRGDFDLYSKYRFIKRQVGTSSGDTAYLGKGRGKAIVMALVEKIKGSPNAKRIIVQPEPENKSSCGTLLPCGFASDAKNEIYVLGLPASLA